MKKKRRFIILGIVLVLMLLSSVVYIALHGHSYTERIDRDFLIPPDKPISEIDGKVTAKPKTEGIVEVGKIYLDGDSVCVEFDSIKEGSVDVDISTGAETYVLSLYVSAFGTIFSPISLNFDGYVGVEHVILFGMLLVFIVMVYSYIECVVKRRFSYSMVAYGGLALFTAFLIFFSYLGMGSYNFFRGFLMDMLNTGFQMSLLTAPFMIAFCVAIAVSNIWLLVHEGVRAHNMLGIVLAFFWFLGVVSTYFSFDLLINFDLSTAVYVSFSLAYIFSFLECLLLSTILSAFLAAKRKASFDRNYLIVLGCRVMPDGRPTPILRSRVDAAVKFEKAQFAAAGIHAKFVPSGGKGSDEVISESESMKLYLVEQGYPADRVVTEDKSVNTDQNIKFSRKAIEADAGSLKNVKAAFVTTNYHVFRGYVLAQKHNFDVQGISAKTKWYFFPNAFLREFVGLVAERKWRIALVLFLIIAGYTFSIHLLSFI